MEEVSLEVGARFGGIVGHALLVPYALPAPGGDASLKWTHRFNEKGYGRLQIGASLGVSPETVAIGYGLQAAIGWWWFDVGWLGVSSETHGGLASLALLPLPRVGLAHTLVVRPVVVDWFTWDARAKVDTDLHLVFPAASLTVSTSARVTAGWWVAAVEVGAKGDVFIGWAFNSAGASAYAQVSTGARF